MKVLFIAYVDFKPTQVGASVRPQKMYRAFLDAGHEVKLLAVSQNRSEWPRRKAAIREIMEWLDTLKDLLQAKTDRLLRQADIVYVPCRECREIFSEYADVRPLPPAGEDHRKYRGQGDNTAIYVGGITASYGGALMLEAFHRLNEEGAYPLLLICRRNEWEKLDSPFKAEPWLEVHHATSEQLVPYYERAGIALAINRGTEYDDYAISVKLYEYIGFGLPIVVCGSKSMERMIEEGGFGRRAECTPEAIAEAVKYVLAHRDEYAERAEEALLRSGLWLHRVEQVVRELSEKKTKK